MYKLLSAFLLVSVLQGLNAFPANHIQNDIFEKLEEDIAESIISSDLLFDRFDYMTSLQSKSFYLEDTLYEELDNIGAGRLDNHTIQCIIDNAGPIKQIIEGGKKAIEVCIENGKNRYAKLVQKIDAIKEQIQEKIEEGKKIVAECAEATPGDVVAIINCTNEKGGPIRDALIALIQKMREAVHEGEKELISIIADTRSCIHDAALKAREEIFKVVEVIKKCIANGNI